MADVHSPAQRSYNMSRIECKNTSPEKIARSFLFRHGFRFKINSLKLPGKPDIVLPKHKTVVLIHGCFWHGHEGCRYYVEPKSNTLFWRNKISGNKERDKRNEQKLREDGWKVLVVWECELKPNKREITLKKLVAEINNKA